MCSLTRAVSQIILLALDSILQALGFAARLLDALLHRLRSDLVRHGEEDRLDAGVNWISMTRKTEGRWKLR